MRILMLTVYFKSLSSAIQFCHTSGFENACCRKVLHVEPLAVAEDLVLMDSGSSSLVECCTSLAFRFVNG